MSNLWPKKWSRSLKKFENCSLTGEFLKQYLTEVQWSLTGGDRLREEVARRELTVVLSDTATKKNELFDKRQEPYEVDVRMFFH